MASLGSWSEAARDRFQGGRPLAERRPVSHPSTQRCFVYVRAVTTSEDAVARLRAAIAKLEPGEDRPPTQDGGFWVELLRITLDGWAEACEMALRWTGAGMLEAERRFGRSSATATLRRCHRDRTRPRQSPSLRRCRSHLDQGRYRPPPDHHTGTAAENPRCGTSSREPDYAGHA